jgi:hypothetical protein
MIIKKSKKLDLNLIYPDTIFIDNRGQYIKSLSKNKYKSYFDLDFVEDEFSINTKVVLKDPAFKIKLSYKRLIISKRKSGFQLRF